MKTIEIAIPSYNRQYTLGAKTLKLLCEFPDSYIKIYVENAEQFDEYIKYYSRYSIIITNTTGIIQKRNYIFKNTTATYLLMLDDDLSNVKDIKGKILSPFDIKRLIYDGFETCDKEEARVWGINPYNNNFYFKNNYSKNLKFIIGAWFGLIIKNNTPLLIPESLTLLEDYYLCIKYFIEDKKIIRFNQYGITQKYFSGVGGIQSLYSNEERIEQQNINVKMLQESYPEHCSIITKKNCLDLRLNHRAR